MVGDILISSGIIAYLGVFETGYRKDCIENWIEMVREFSIKSSDTISLNGVLGN